MKPSAFLTLPLFLLPLASSITAQVIDSFAPLYVTSDGPGTHIVSPTPLVSFPSSGLPTFDSSGVANLNLTKIEGSGTIRCSGTLLPTGRHVLTAAHCLIDELTGEFNVSGGSAIFALTGILEPVTIESFVIHPNYDGTTTHGYDFAIITLAENASDSVKRYDILRSPALGMEIGVPTLKVGFGSTGHGSTGKASSDGIKRAGLNEYEAFDMDLVPGILHGDTQIIYDFDSGSPVNDGGEIVLGLAPNLGFGDDEVGASTGDSGGPTMVYDLDSNSYLVAGVTSYGLRFSDVPDGMGGTTNSDLDSVLNNSFGEFMVDGRVATISEWIDATIAPIPEPSTTCTLLSLISILVFRRKIKTTE